MGPDQFAASGFFLAMNLMGSLGIKFDAEGKQTTANPIMQRLAEVARGETSLYNSATEELAEAEKNRGGQPATAEERAYFEAAFGDRKMHDARNQSTANQILRAIGGDVLPPPPRGPAV